MHHHLFTRPAGLTILCTLLLALSSCSIYHPQAVDIPLINHAGDTRIDAGLGVSSWVFPDVMTFNLTGSYGINDWLAAQAHINYGGDNVYGQVAPGAYLPLGEHGLLEGYAGLGMGSAWRKRVDATAQSDTGTSHHNFDYSGRYSVPFGQVNIGWHDLTGAHIDLALGLKAGAYLPSFTYRSYENAEATTPSTVERYTTPSALLEPQLLFRIGSERVKFCLRLSYAWLSDMYEGGDGNHFTADLFTLSAGLNFSF